MFIKDLITPLKRPVFAPGTHAGFYRQIDGLAMGSPPAPHLANSWMSQYDNNMKGNYKLYTRYTDDILCDIEKCKMIPN